MLERVLQTIGLPLVVLGAELTWMGTSTVERLRDPGTACRALPPRDDDRFGRAHQLEEAFAHQLEDALRSPGASFG